MISKATNLKNQVVNRFMLIALHVIAAGTFVFIPLMLFGPRLPRRNGPPHGNFGAPPPGDRMTEIDVMDFHSMRLQSVVFNVVLICFFYFNMYVLVPHVLTKRSWIHYVGAIAVCFAVMLGINEGIENLMASDTFRPGRPIYFTVINFLLVFGLSTALRLTSDRVAFERDRKERETENLKSELALLRSQVSPHFMFNVLNNLVSLARKKSDQLEPIIIQLSHLMRYMLYDSGEKRVSLKDEVDYLQSYIDLQKLRFGNDVEVKFDKNISSSETPIEPMLLIPFVENAFKHGIGMIQAPQIIITLSAANNVVHFVVKNKFTETIETKDASSGIGIQNVRRRLDLLYKDTHELTIFGADSWFIVELKLVLK